MFQESSWPQMALLQEMFPAASPAEARHCLAVAGGDIAKAAQLALHRQEAGQSIVSNLTFLTVRILTMTTALPLARSRSKMGLDYQLLKKTYKLFGRLFTR